MNVNKLSASIRSIGSKFQNKISSIGSNTSLTIRDKIGFMVFIIILLMVVVSIIIYNLYKEPPIEKNAKNMKSITSNLKLQDITSTNFKNFRLGDYYIMASYNSCCGGDYERDIVDTNTLAEVIGMGVRYLDFEIYSVDGRTVVASSSSDDIYRKGTFNELNISDVFDMIKLTAFGHLTPNSNDPLFIQLRIKSNQKRVYDDISKQIKSKCKGKLLGANFAFANRNSTIYNTPMKELQSKIIICVESDDPYFKQSPLYEFTNIHAGSGTCYTYRMQDITAFINPLELTNRNRNYISIVKPDLHGNTNSNMNAIVPFEYGCQIVCMKFQHHDSNLEYYVKQFNDTKSAFLLRPKDMRENTIDVHIDEYKGQHGSLDTKVKPTVMGNLHI